MSGKMPTTTIDKYSLPAISAEYGTYFIRYRIVSENQNNSSYWSPIYEVDPEFTYISGSATHSVNSDQVRLVWTPITIIKNSNNVGSVREYDIWLNWYKNAIGVGDWIYETRVESTSFSINIPSTYYINGVNQNVKPDRLLVEIYIKGTPITRDFTLLRVYNPSAINV